VAADKLATDIVILDMREVVTYTDWFVICSGRIPRQTQAIAEELRKGIGDDRLRPQRIEGERQGDWILLDYTDVVAHVFTPEARAYYRLENLWGQVPSSEYVSASA
jgi:ribosome-associated protein